MTYGKREDTRDDLVGDFDDDVGNEEWNTNSFPTRSDAFKASIPATMAGPSTASVSLVSPYKTGICSINKSIASIVSARGTRNPLSIGINISATSGTMTI